MSLVFRHYNIITKFAKFLRTSATYSRILSTPLSTTKMPYKLLYFNAKGRAQSIRYMLADNHLEYTEETFDLGNLDTWKAAKPKTLLGQLPILYDGEFEIAQSNTIRRYLARKHDLYGSNDREMTMIDMISDLAEDVRLSFGLLCWGDLEGGKEAYIKALPDKLRLFEKLMKMNTSDSGFVVGNKISYADYQAFSIFDDLMVLAPDCLDDLPLLKEFHTRMAARDPIAKIRASEEFKKMKVFGNGKP